MNDTLLVEDLKNEGGDKEKLELSKILKPLNTATNPDFSTWTQYYKIDQKFKIDVRDIANKVIRFSANTSAPNLERKLVFITPIKDEINQVQLDYLKKLILYLSNADANLSSNNAAVNPYINSRNRNAFIGNIAKVFVSALESSAGKDHDQTQPGLIEFNENLEKFCETRPNVVFMRATLNTAVGSVLENGNYLPSDRGILVPPNLRVNFNLALNYYWGCGGVFFNPSFFMNSHSML